MNSLDAPAKINVALVVGPRRADGKHELATVYERLRLADRLTLEPVGGLVVDGFPADTIVALALETLARAAGVKPAWRVSIEKRIPVGAGLGGGSSDAAAALLLANQTLERPLPAASLHDVAVSLGADVPLFLTAGPQLGEGDGTRLTPLRLPRDYCVVLLLPEGAAKHSTKAVYDAFDDRRGDRGFESRREALLSGLQGIESVGDLAALPGNDLASSPLAAELTLLGAVRADVSGAGPTVYGIFEQEADARSAARALAGRGRVWVTFPAWYG